MFKQALALSFAAATAMFIGSAPAQAFSAAECSAKYQAAKADGSLGTMKWNDFRKTQCADAATDPAAKTDKKADKPAKADKTKADKPAKKPKADKAAASDATATGKLSAKECSAQYQAAKDANTLNGMKWNDFRKTVCAGNADAAATVAPAADPAPKLNTFAAAPADSKMSAKDCSALYQAAKAANTLNGMKWNDFRKTQCAGGASAAAAAAPAADAPILNTFSAAPAKLSAKDCSALYQTAKAADALGGMKWNDFRKAKCSGDAAAVAEPAALPAPAADAPIAHLSMADCSAKYQAAKAANTLNGQKWNDFRKTACVTDSQDAPDQADVVANFDPIEPPLVSTAKAPKGVKLPSIISSQYANESAGKARMHTCVDAYHVNKDNGTLNGLKWIQKGGGFYSLCNSRLKGL